MFACDKPLRTFDCPQKPFGFVGINRMLDVFLVCNQFKILQSVVLSIKIFMIDLKATFNRTYKRFPQRTMNGHPHVLAFSASHKSEVMVRSCRCFHWSIFSISRPCFSCFDHVGAGNTCTKELSNLSKQRAAGKHLFGNGYQKWVQFLPSGRSTNTRKSADLIQAFKADNRFPYLHTLLQFKLNWSIA